MVRIVCKHYDNGLGKPYSVATLHSLTKDKRGKYTIAEYYNGINGVNNV